MSSHPLTNFEIQKYQNEPRFNGVHSRDGAYAISPDEYSDIETH